MTDACDSKETWGTHNLDLGKQSGSIWHPFELNVTSYVVPPEVISVVGGEYVPLSFLTFSPKLISSRPMGGATATAPTGGFDNADLAVYFTQRASLLGRSATRAIPSPGPTSMIPSPLTIPDKKAALSKGVIAGIATGSVAVFSALLIGLFFYIRHHKSRLPGPAEIYTSSIPQSRHSHFSQTEYMQHQIQSNSIPAELSNSNSQAEINPKEIMMQQVNERNHPIYARWEEISPPAASPLSLLYSPVTAVTQSRESQTSHVQTYSSTERNSRGALRNQTYYSP